MDHDTEDPTIAKILEESQESEKPWQGGRNVLSWQRCITERKKERGRWRLTRNAAPSWPPPPPPSPPSSPAPWNHPLHPFDGHPPGEGRAPPLPEWPLATFLSFFPSLTLPPLFISHSSLTSFMASLIFTIKRHQSTNDSPRREIWNVCNKTCKKRKKKKRFWNAPDGRWSPVNKPPSLISPPRQ